MVGWKDEYGDDGNAALQVTTGLTADGAVDCETQTSECPLEQDDGS